MATPPVLEVKTDPTGRGRFAFIELRTAALALAALQLDKVCTVGVGVTVSAATWVPCAFVLLA